MKNKENENQVIKSGVVFTINEKLINVVNVKENIVKYTSTKFGKNTKIKKMKISDFKELMRKGNFSENENSANIGNNQLQVKAVKIDMRDLINKSFNLKEPLGNGSTSLYVFSVDAVKGKALVGFNEDDENPTWFEVQKFINLVRVEEVITLAQEVIDVSPEDLRKALLEKIKETSK